MKFINGVSESGERLELGGDHMKIVEDDEGGALITFDDNGTGRRCGECTLCCRLLPVPPLFKAAGQKCRYQKVAKGCSIYPQRPFTCKAWSCRWLADPTTAGMPRPDRAHYVIDLEYDYVTMKDNETGEERHVQVVQIWCDPLFPEACNSKPLRDYMLMMAEKWKVATIIRFNSRDAITVFPPPLSSDHQWHTIVDGTVVSHAEREVRFHTATRPDKPPVVEIQS